MMRGVCEAGFIFTTGGLKGMNNALITWCLARYCWQLWSVVQRMKNFQLVASQE
jgi:hypothetical protein